MSVKRADLLEIAVTVARRAGEVAMRPWGPRLTAEAKADDSPVTAADREAERLCRQLIEARFPADAVLGEEYGETRAGARRRWILDPIDGTRTYVHGVPLFGVLIAVEEEGEAVIGVIHLPALGETVAAARGEGCWHNDARARVSSVDRLDRALVLTTDLALLQRHGRDRGWQRLAGEALTARTWGDCYGHLLVATGRAEAMVDPVLMPWDSAPLLPILEEAGGVFTDWQGAASHLATEGIATNAALSSRVRELLGVGEEG